MSLLSALAALVAPPIELTRMRGDYPSFEEQLAAIQRRSSVQTFRTPSVDEALGVPAIFGAVSLICGTMGTLSMEAYRNGALMASEDRPRMVVRPNPFSAPYTFNFLTSFYKATRGETWWWVAARDIDGSPMSLYPVPPWEITVAQNDRNRLRPTITWGNRVMRNEDMIQDIWFPDSLGLRGRGPLQMAGAAVSVTVESQMWAANFYSGALPSVIGTTDQDMSEDELKLMDKQWLEKPPNMPRWLTNGLTLTESPMDPEKAQLTESRQHQVGEVARMFNMPGPLLEHQMSGSSLTYRNESGIWTDFKQRCLAPTFTEPMEQNMSDLLPRTISARFNFDQLLRADIQTRFEAYKIGIDAGFLTPEEARQKEGYAPGAVDYAPVPLAPPQAVPTLLPINRSRLEELRCSRCGRLAGKVNGQAEIKCQRCGSLVVAA